MSEENKKVEEEASEGIGKENIEETPKKRKFDSYLEIALFLILGILVGVAVKTEAAKRITIGHGDYKVKSANERYNLNQLKREQLEKMKALTETMQSAQEQQNIDQPENQAPQPNQEINAQ